VSYCSEKKLTVAWQKYPYDPEAAGMRGEGGGSQVP
jgi:hypothetical protein